MEVFSLASISEQCRRLMAALFELSHLSLLFYIRLEKSSHNIPRTTNNPKNFEYELARFLFQNQGNSKATLVTKKALHLRPFGEQLKSKKSFETNYIQT